MKKLIITISIFFTLISLAEARQCKSGDIKGDAFIYSDGKKVTVIKGTDIPNPENKIIMIYNTCLLYTSPSPRDKRQSRMPSSA